MRADTRMIDRHHSASAKVMGLSLMLMTGIASAVTISDAPLILPTPMSPNIVVTLDDSSSMIEAYVPEICGATWDGVKACTCADHASNYGTASSYSINTTGSTYEAVAWCDASHVGENILNSRRYKSSAFNSLYYNPSSTYSLPVNAAGTALTAPTFTAAYYNGFDSSQGTINLSTSYRPSVFVWQYVYNNYASFYNAHVVANNPSADFPSSTTSGVAAYYYKYDTALTGCATQTATTLNDDACYSLVTVSTTSGTGGTDERQNFANWYSFYRSRNLMTISGASLAFANLNPATRVAWQSLNSCNTFGTACSGTKSPATNLDNRIKPFTGTHKEDFYKWLQRLPTGANGNVNTPLRSATTKAGQYYETSGVNSPYAQDPTVSVGTEYSCRPNFHILMTDGIWNNGTSNADSNANVSLYGTIGNYDGTAHTLPDGTSYGATAPYQDSQSSSLADIAFYYWARDLRGDLSNNLLPYWGDRTGDDLTQYKNAKNDPAEWQHMVNFTVGLGLSSFLTNPAWGGDTFSGGYSSLVDGSATWPTVGADVVPGNVYDLWHAALNSRGQFFSAENAQTLTSALTAALVRIKEQESSASALAANSTKLNLGSVVFQAKFDSSDWSGQLIAYPVSTDTGTIENALWNVGDPLQHLIPVFGSRNILSWSGTAGINFTWDSLSASQKNLIDSTNAGNSSSPVLNYLRGDNSNAGTSGTHLYRARTKPLGDIINSDPYFVGAPDFGYDVLTEGSTYQAFVNTNKIRHKMLYVGANDGMLHAIDVDANGSEVFAYVPNAVISNLALLASPSYTHKFYVDGPSFVGDAYFNSAWKTVLLGATGAGGKAVFAMDVTTPTSVTAANVLWEFTHSELGYTIGQPIIARLNNGRWAAIFGNGYNSTSGTAKLFIVFLDANPSDGWQAGSTADYMVIDTDNSITNNGLATVSLYDSNGDKVVDTVYAGDMQGNVWKFDLSGNNTGQWGSAYKTGSTPKPLFTACRDANGNSTCDTAEHQPITGPIELGAAPSGQSGVMVYFGTGRFFATGDNLDLSVQSLYGILDSGTRISSSLRSGLQQQSIIFEGTDTGRADDASTTANESRSATTQNIRVTSQNSVNYTTQRGWYLDLLPPSNTAKGERVISIPLLRFGRVIFTTMIPSQDPCAFGGTSWIMELDATSGARLSYSVFDFSGDSVFDAKDYVEVTIGGVTVYVPVSGVESTVGIIKTPTVLSAGTIEYKIASGTTSEVSSTAEKGGSLVTGRVSWRELMEE